MTTRDQLVKKSVGVTIYISDIFIMLP